MIAEPSTAASRIRILDSIVTEYFATRPNLNIQQPPLAVFFLACAGAGKTTLRKQLVERLQLTHVCNDEVKILLREQPEAARLGIGFKEIVAATWERIMCNASNRAVVFDTSVILHHSYNGSYIDVARDRAIPFFVIGLESPTGTLETRIRARGIDVEQTVSYMYSQARAYHRVRSDIEPDWSHRGDLRRRNLDELVAQLESFIRTL